jgi:hypothetical protein
LAHVHVPFQTLLSPSTLFHFLQRWQWHVLWAIVFRPLWRIKVRLKAGFSNLNGVFFKEQRRHVHGIFIV